MTIVLRTPRRYPIHAARTIIKIRMISTKKAIETSVLSRMNQAMKSSCAVIITSLLLRIMTIFVMPGSGETYFVTASVSS